MHIIYNHSVEPWLHGAKAVISWGVPADYSLLFAVRL